MEQTISLHPLRQTQYSIPAHETIMPSKVPLTAIVAMGARGEIGQDGTMPWHLPEDLRHFKEITMGRAVIMGRATWESLPRRPLPGRRNIVVTRRGDYIAEGADTAKSVAEAVALCAPKERPVIIGGASIYEAALPYCDILNITRIKATFPAADTYFPAIQENFWEVIQEDGPFTSKTGLEYTFHTLHRK